MAGHKEGSILKTGGWKT